MGRDNAQMIGELYALISRGEMDSVLARLDPAIVWEWPRSSPDRSVYQGRDGFKDGIERWSEAWDDFAMEAEELISRGDEVLALVRYSGRGKASGIPIEDNVVGHLWELRGGTPVRLRMFSDAQRARRRFLEESDQPD